MMVVNPTTRPSGLSQIPHCQSIKTIHWMKPLRRSSTADPANLIFTTSSAVPTDSQQSGIIGRLNTSL
jgi:hypothetical protein